MAFQHLYSRVPAKISMYNRADSFDTFARSEGLDREFIEKDLGVYSDIRLTSKEYATLRNIGLQPLYFQYKGKNGYLVQSCVSFIPSDYTGERSSYFIHSYISDENEQKELVSSADLNTFEGNAFEKDLGKFDITNPSKRPDNNYPSIKIPQNDVGEYATWLNSINPNTMHRFIYATLACMCGKIKSVYFYLGLEDEEISEKTLEFINAYLQILPYHLRTEFSFVTKLSDQTRFTGIRFKSVSSEIGSVPSTKGALMNLKSGIFNGFKDDDINQNFQLVDFIYSLINDDPLRREFLLFAQRAVEKVPSLGALSLKALSDLVYLFKASCSRYDLLKVIPNDERFYDFITIYEKNRTALSDEYRINAMQALRRYPESYKEIPKKVFTKLTKLYPTEPSCVKLVVMDVCLDLIHTDVMRDKLFAFIRSNYQTEPINVKEKIVDDLSRVYYGGFLMEDILSFFNEIYKAEKEASKNCIFDKVVLTLRSANVEPLIIEFLHNNFDYLSDENREKLYLAIVEILADGDDISRDYAVFLNEHIELEDKDIQDKVEEQLKQDILAEQKRRNHPIVSLLSALSGWTSRIVTELVLGGNKGGKVYEEYLSGLCRGEAMQRAKNLAGFFTLNPDISREETIELYSACAERFDSEELTSESIDIAKADNYLMDTLKNVSENAKDFAEEFSNSIWPKYVMKNINNMFLNKGRLDVIKDLYVYGASHDGMLRDERFKYATSYYNFVRACEFDDMKDGADALAVLGADRKFGKVVGDYAAKDVPIDKSKQNLFRTIALGILKTDTMDLGNLYAEKLKDVSEEDELKVSFELLKKLVVFCSELSSKHVERFENLVSYEASGISAIVKSFGERYNKEGIDKLNELIESLENEEYKALLKTTVDKLDVKKDGLFGKLFQKK